MKNEVTHFIYLKKPSDLSKGLKFKYMSSPEITIHKKYHYERT